MPIPLRASFAAMAAETRRDRRAAIEAAVRLQLRELNALFEAQFTAQRTLVEPLGYASPEASGPTSCRPRPRHSRTWRPSS